MSDEDVLADRKTDFGKKKLLTPAEIAPYMSTSPLAQARKAGYQDRQGHRQDQTTPTTAIARKNAYNPLQAGHRYGVATAMSVNTIRRT